MWKVNMGCDETPRQHAAGTAVTGSSGTRRASCPRPGFSLVVVEPGQPAGQAVHRRLELRGQVDELTQPLRQPAQADLVVRPPLGEFLDALVGGVHRPS